MSFFGATKPLSNLILTKGSINFNGWAMLAQWPFFLISTKSSIGMDFKVRAVPSSGTQEIYRGDIYSKKKILWLINVNSYLVKCRVNSISSMMPLDNAPGGVYDVNVLGFDAEVIEGQLPDFFDYKNVATVQPRFCFIPTASSLDISNFNANYLKPLCDTAACISPARVKDYFAPLANEIHITYTQPSADWILTQQGANVNCTKICKNNLYLDGFLELCTSNTYMTNLPTGAIATWTVTPTGLASIAPGSLDNSTIHLNRIGSFSGYVTLKVSIINPCNSNLVELSKLIYVGTPQPVSIIPAAVGPSGTLKPNTVYPFTPLPNSPPIGVNITDYQWEVVSGGIVFGGTQYNQFAQIKTDALAYGQSEKNITVRFRWKSCEWSDWIYYTGRIVKNGGHDPIGFNFTVYPNPASGQVEIVQQEESASSKINAKDVPSESQTKAVEWIKITDLIGNIKLERIYNKSESFKSDGFNISGWTPGQYIAYIFDGETVQQVSFVVSH